MRNQTPKLRRKNTTNNTKKLTTPTRHNNKQQPILKYIVKGNESSDKEVKGASVKENESSDKDMKGASECKKMKDKCENQETLKISISTSEPKATSTKPNQKKEKSLENLQKPDFDLKTYLALKKLERDRKVGTLPLKEKPIAVITSSKNSTPPSPIENREDDSTRLKLLAERLHKAAEQEIIKKGKEK